MALEVEVVVQVEAEVAGVAAVAVEPSSRGGPGCSICTSTPGSSAAF